jgi:hypothetical protein
MTKFQDELAYLYLSLISHIEMWLITRNLMSNHQKDSSVLITEASLLA